MRGEMKNFIFENLVNHDFFRNLQIPSRRFSRELTASQIAINYFSLKIRNEFTRARFADLQEFFKEFVRFNSDAKIWSKELQIKVDDINKYLKEKIKLGNRAISITLFFFINKLIEENKKNKIENFLDFFEKFQNKLKEQVALGIDIDRNFRDLLKFQSYISNAAAEKYAIENRQKLLEEYFDFYLKNNQKIKGEK